MYTYYGYVKLLQEIHLSNEAVLQDPLFRQQIASNKLKLLKLTKEYKSSHYIKQLSQLITADLDEKSLKLI